MAKIELSKIVLLSFLNCMNYDRKHHNMGKIEIADKFYTTKELFDTCIKYGNTPEYFYKFYPHNEAKYPEQYNNYVKEVQFLCHEEFVEQRERTVSMIIPNDIKQEHLRIEYRLTSKGKDQIREWFTANKQQKQVQ